MRKALFAPGVSMSLDASSSVNAKWTPRHAIENLLRQTLKTFGLLALIQPCSRVGWAYSPTVARWITGDVVRSAAMRGWGARWAGTPTLHYGADGLRSS